MKRAELLAAGREALLNEGIDLLADGLTIGRVASRAGLSPQTFHNAFPNRSGKGGHGSKEAFIEELLGSLLDEYDRDVKSRAEELLARQAMVVGGDPRRLVRELCRWDYERVRAAPETQLRIVACALALGNRRAVASAIASYCDLLGVAYAMTDGVFAAWGTSLRLPFTLDKLTVVMSALVEGLVLRSRFDPAAVPPELFGDAVLALLGSVVDIEQTHEHIDDVVAPLAAVAMSEYAHRERALPDDPEQAVIDAARIEFSQRNYLATTRAQIAARAGVDLDTLHRLFPSNVDIVVAGLVPVYEAMKRRVAVDVRLGEPAKKVLQRYGLLFAEAILAERALFDAMAVIISLHTAQGPVNATRVLEELYFPNIILETIEVGCASGTFVTDVPATELAAIYSNNILLRCLSRRGETAAQATHVIDQTFLRGILAPGA